MNKRDYLVMKWNSACVDWKHKNIKSSIQSIKSNLHKNNLIAVFHDYIPETAFNISVLIETFLNQTKTNPFIPLEECLNYY